MRVIAGTARRTALVAPLGLNTRPTSDRAKENLFNIIFSRIEDTRFLDIFCGSGAIGIEALSRGAKEAVFIENSALAIKALKENLQKTKLQNAEIIETDAKKALSLLSGRKFDIIFLDPPYDSSLLEQTIKQISAENLLAENGIIIAETEQMLEFPEYELISYRKYGRTVFLFFEPRREDETHGRTP